MHKTNTSSMKELQIETTSEFVTIIFFENREPDFLIRETTYINSQKQFNEALTLQQHPQVQILMEDEMYDTKIYNAKVKQICRKEQNVNHGDSDYENILIQFINNEDNDNTNTNADNNNNTQYVSYWDLYYKCDFVCDKMKLLHQKVKEQLDKIYNKNRNDLYVFYECVDEIRDNAKGYYNVVPVPMYLDLISKRLNNYYYITIDSMKFDFELMYTNACMYNSEESFIVKKAKIFTQKLKEEIDKEWNVIEKQFNHNSNNNKDNGDDKEDNKVNTQMIQKKRKRFQKELDLDNLVDVDDETNYLFNHRSMRTRSSNNNNSNVKSSYTDTLTTSYSSNKKTKNTKFEIINTINTNNSNINDIQLKEHNNNNNNSTISTRNKYKNQHQHQ